MLNRKLLYSDINSFLVIFALIDLLYLPRLTSFLAIPISLCFLPFVLKDIKLNTNHSVIIVFFLLSIIGSLLYSTILNKELLTDDIKRALQLISFSLYLYSSSIVKYNERTYLLIIRIFLIWIFILSLLFLFDPNKTINTMLYLYPESAFIEEENLTNLRFSYAFQDPNGAAYLYVMILSVYLILEKNQIIKYILLSITCYSLFLTQSRGAISSFLLVILYFVFFDRKYLPKYFLFYLLIIALFILYLISKSHDIMNILDMFLSRGDKESSLGGGRFDKYIYFINNINLLPFGVGYNLSRNGEIFRPHSDLIRINLSYGIMLTFIIIGIIVPKVKNQIALVIPFIFCFLINSALDEYRLIGVYLILNSLLYFHREKYSSNQE